MFNNHWTNFNHTWHKASLGEGDSSCSNKGTSPFPMGYNYEIAKIHSLNLKSSSQEPLDQFQPNLAQSIPCLRGHIFFSNEGSRPFLRRDNYEIAK